MPERVPGRVPRRLPRRLAGSLLATSLLTLSACGGGTPSSPGAATGVSVEDDDGFHGAVLTTPYTLPDAVLTDSRGEPFRVSENLEPDLTLVFFGYSKCPDICQAVMADVAATFNRLDADEADRVRMWFVTTDPARDDPETLRRYLDRFNPDFEGLTGPLPDIVALAQGVHVPIEKGPKLPSGGYEVTHGTPVLGVREDGSVPILWTEGTSAAKMTADLEVLLSDGFPDPQETR